MAKEIDLKDQLQNAVYRWSAGRQQNVGPGGESDDGHGTVRRRSTARREGHRGGATGHQARHRKGRQAINGRAQKMKKDVGGNMVAQVGTISANNDETIGKIIAEAMVKSARTASSR